MKTADDALQFIEHQFANYLQHPAMYALSPQAMEHMLIALDLVRLYIVSGPLQPDAYEFTGQYFDFLMQQGCGAAMFTIRFKAEPDEQLFGNLCRFWRRYLSQSSPPIEID